MRRRHLESVSSRSLSVRESWGTVPSAFWYGAPGGTQGPLGKGRAAERWRAVYPIGIATRHGAKPATTRTYKSRPPPGRCTGFAPCKINAPPPGVLKPSPRGSGANYAFAKSSPRRRRDELWHNLYHQSLRHGCAVPPPFTQGRLSPLGTHKFSPKIFLPPFSHGKADPQPRPLSIVFPGALW